MKDCSVKECLEMESDLVFELMLLVDIVEYLEEKDLIPLKFSTNRAKKVLNTYWEKRLCTK